MRQDATRWILALLPILILAACHDPDEFLGESTVVEEALDVNAAALELPADGESELEIVASIAANADPDKRTIVFQTTGGTFKNAAANNPKMAVVEAAADAATAPRLGAVATLVAGSAVETVEVRVSIMGVSAVPPEALSIDFIAPDVSSIIELSTANPTAPADGQTRTRVTAVVSRPGRSVRFTTSLGEFVGFSDGPATVLSDARSEAIVELKSPTTVGGARITATVGSTTVETGMDFEAVPVTVAAATNVVPADGQTPTSIVAEVGTPFAMVTFGTTAGTLTSATVAADGAGRATTTLRSPKTIGNARITATVPGGLGETTIEFARAHPERIVVTLAVPSLQASPTQSARIETVLLRDVGTVTDGAVVSYEAIDPTSGAVVPVIFQNRAPSVDGKATASLVAGDIAFRGALTVRGTVSGIDLAGMPISVSGEESILIVDPQ